MTFDIDTVRAQFPFLAQEINGYPLTYLDSAATSQKPQVVIDTLANYYRFENANVHRGSHHMTAQATSRYEAARDTVAQWIGAAHADTIIWTRGTTEAINLVAYTYALKHLQAGDEIAICENEHHANIVPWQLIAQQTGANIIKIPVTAHGEFDWDYFQNVLTKRCKLVAVAHITNVTGARQPIEAIIHAAHDVGAKVMVDGAQGVVHETVDVTQLDVDFYAFSGHKLYAPNGIGVLYVKPDILPLMPVWQGGGKMVERVSFAGTSFAPAPSCFEAGTPNVAGAIGLAAAMTWLKQFDYQDIKQHISHLHHTLYEGLVAIDDLYIIGHQPGSGIISFTMDGVHHHDIATLLDQQGIVVREGHHCAHPLMDALDISGTVRLSLSLYNNEADITRALAAIKKAADIL